MRDHDPTIPPARSPSMATFSRRLSLLRAAVLTAAFFGSGLVAEAQDTKTLTWSALGTLSEVATPDGTISFAYDGDGQRVSKSDAAGTTLYIRDAAGTLIAEYDKATGEHTDYVYMGPRRIASVSASGERRYYHADQVGTPMVVTDSGGNAVWRGEALPFGEEVKNSDPEQDDTLKFTGKELDEGTGLHYFGARYYDARVGRFISVDPLGGDVSRPQSLNRYAYARNNPIARLDPDGAMDYSFLLSLVKPIALFACMTCSQTEIPGAVIKLSGESHLERVVMDPTRLMLEEAARASGRVPPEELVIRSLTSGDRLNAIVYRERLRQEEAWEEFRETGLLENDLDPENRSYYATQLRRALQQIVESDNLMNEFRDRSNSRARSEISQEPPRSAGAGGSARPALPEPPRYVPHTVPSRRVRPPRIR